MISVFGLQSQMGLSPCRAYRMPPFSIELLQQGGKSISHGWIVFHAFFPTKGTMSSHENSQKVVFIINILLPGTILLIID